MNQEHDYSLRISNEKSLWKHCFHRLHYCNNRCSHRHFIKSSLSNTVPTKFKAFCEKYRTDANLTDKDTLECDMVHYARIESTFFSKHIYHFFNAVSDKDVVHSNFDTGRDLEYSSYLVSTCEHTRSTSSLRKLANHTSPTPSRALRPSTRGMKKSMSNSEGLIKNEVDILHTFHT